ncbi:MAG TPA: hypothetical protein VLV76_28855 [Candidatus Acidoferrum sp.]|nr:hypothetical protein [Candidatus Acidoferrum sp.]
MTKLLMTAALAAVMFVGATSDASAWTRKSTVTTHRGTYTSEATGSCVNYTCTRSGTTTGPNGQQVTTSGSITKTAPGQYDYSRSITGPNGGTATSQGTITITH